jgi:hypothetical protein
MATQMMRSPTSSSIIATQTEEKVLQQPISSIGGFKRATIRHRLYAILPCPRLPRSFVK